MLARFHRTETQLWEAQTKNTGLPPNHYQLELEGMGTHLQVLALFDCLAISRFFLVRLGLC